MATKIQKLGKVTEIQITGRLVELNTDADNNGMYYTRYRACVQFPPNVDDLPPNVRALYDKLSEVQKAVIMKNATTLTYSNIFRAENILTKADGTPWTTPDGGVTAENTPAVIKAIRDAWAAIGNENIFTVWSESVEALLKGTAHDGVTAVYTDSGAKLTSRSRLFVGFFDEEETAIRMLRTSLLSHIDEVGDLYTADPTATTPSENITDNLGL